MLKEYIEKGEIQCLELSKDILLLNLFEEKEDGIITFSEKVFGRQIDPRFTNAYLITKTNSYSYWSEEIFIQMTDFFKELE